MERNNGQRRKARPSSASVTSVSKRHSYLHLTNQARPNSNTNKNKSSRAIDPSTGVQVGRKSAAPPRNGIHYVGKEWFGEGRRTLRDTRRPETFQDQYRKSKRGTNRFPTATPTFGVKKNSGTKVFRKKFQGEYAGKTFLHDQEGGVIAVAGSAALAARERKRRKPPMKNKHALKIIANWFALGGRNMAAGAEDRGVTEQHASISYDALHDMLDAFRLLQRGDHGEGDMISTHQLRALLLGEAEALSGPEMDALIGEADPGNTGFVNFKTFASNIVRARLPHLAKGSHYGPQDDVVMRKQRERIKREKGERQRKEDLKAMGLDPDIVVIEC